MEPLYYVRIARRRLRLIVACGLVGALLGLVSTLVTRGDDSTSQLYLASHILWENAATPAGEGTAPVNLDRLRLLMTRGGVPRAVAEDLGQRPVEVLGRTHVVPDGGDRTLTVHAWGSDPDAAEELADTLATAGLAALRDGETQAVEAEVAAIDAEISRLEADLAAQEAELAAATPEAAPTVQAAVDATEAALVERTTARDALTAAPLPSDRLGTLEQASAVAVTWRELDTVLANADPGSGRAFVPGLAGPTEERASITDNAVLRILVGLLVGLAVGMGLAVTLQRFDSKIRNKEEAEAAFGLPVIGEIPSLPRGDQDSTSIVAFEAPRSPTAEAYRALRSSLVFVGHTAPPTDERLPSEYASEKAGQDDGAEDSEGRQAQVILVTSPGPGEGKTTSAANLSVVLAEMGYSVLAINCDFRKPRLHRYLGAEATPRKVIETEIPGVRTITDVVTDSSRLNPAKVVAAQRKVIESARELFDIIVLDTAPLLATNDAVDLLGEADLVVVCCRAGKTSREGAERTVEALRRHEAPVAGCVIVGADEAPAASYYYYYGDRDGPERTRRSRDAADGAPASPGADGPSRGGADGPSLFQDRVPRNGDAPIGVPADDISAAG